MSSIPDFIWIFTQLMLFVILLIYSKSKSLMLAFIRKVTRLESQFLFLGGQVLQSLALDIVWFVSLTPSMWHHIGLSTNSTMMYGNYRHWQWCISWRYKTVYIITCLALLHFLGRFALVACCISSSEDWVFFFFSRSPRPAFWQSLPLASSSPAIHSDCFCVSSDFRSESNNNIPCI